MSVVAKKLSEDKEKKVVIKVPRISKTVDKKKPVSADLPAKLTKLSKDTEYDSVFNVVQNPSLLSQYINAYQSNHRFGNSHTKTRGEVAGSGKKPWKQKHTGRARVGSTRNPVWRHGGVSHGPVPKDWSTKLSAKMRSKAFISALSAKIRNSQVYYIDKLEIKEGRTKEVLTLLSGWGLIGDILIVTENKNDSLLKATGNLKNVEVALRDGLNTYQLVANKNVVFEKLALDKIKEKYAKNK